MSRRSTEIVFDVGAHGKTSAAVIRAADPNGATLIFAHGAGAPRTHPFIEAFAKAVAARGVDVFAFNFLYAEAGRRMPDRTELLETCWRAAVAKVRALSGVSGQSLFVGGKSMGGRMATHIASAEAGLVVDGVVCVGYPLHPAGKPKTRRRVVRGEILGVDLPLLVVQGTKDALGTAKEVARFAKAKANIRVYAAFGVDHSLAGAVAEAADAVARFIEDVRKTRVKR